MLNNVRVYSTIEGVDFVNFSKNINTLNIDKENVFCDCRYEAKMIRDVKKIVKTLIMSKGELEVQMYNNFIEINGVTYNGWNAENFDNLMCTIAKMTNKEIKYRYL